MSVEESADKGTTEIMQNYLPKLTLLTILLPIACGTHDDSASQAEPQLARTEAPLVAGDIPNLQIKEMQVTPYYEESTLGLTYCLGRVAMTVSVCDASCDSDSSFTDTCDLFAAYRGTSTYEKLCPKLTPGISTPKRTLERATDCSGASPTLAVPLGHAQYRVTAKKRGYQDAKQDFSASVVSKWNSLKKLPLKLSGVDFAGLALGYENQSASGAQLDPVAYDNEGYLGEPTKYDATAGAYTVNAPLSSIDFGAAQYGDRVTRIVNVSNVGNEALQLTDVRVDNDTAMTPDNPGFTLASGSPVTIAPGAKGDIAVKFQLNKGDLDSQVLKGKLHIAHNDAYIAAVTGQTAPAAEIELTVKVDSRCPSSCDDGNVCTTDRCQPDVGCLYENNTNSCDDNNACTEGDVCSQGTCIRTPKDCNDGNSCTADACDAQAGCTHSQRCSSDMKAHSIANGMMLYFGGITSGESTSIRIVYNDFTDSNEVFETYPSDVSLGDVNPCFSWRGINGHWVHVQDADYPWGQQPYYVYDGIVLNCTPGVVNSDITEATIWTTTFHRRWDNTWEEYDHTSERFAINLINAAR